MTVPEGDDTSEPDASSATATSGPSGPSRIRPAVGLFALRETRALVGRRGGAIAVGVIASVVAVASLFVGGMLTLVPTQGAYIVEVIWWGPPSAWWFYPEILVVQPWGLLQLPFLPTAAMGLVSVGAGLGSVAGIRLVLHALRRPRAGNPVLAGTAAATGPASGIAAVATLGACCCSTCASTGGLALVAAASGTSVANLLTAEWYLPLFQLVVVYVILLAQERALRYARESRESPPSIDRRFVAGSVLRVALLLAGITWSLAMLVEWGSQDPWTASSGTWYHWIFEHQALSLLAIVAGLFPRELGRAVRNLASTPIGWIGRAGFAAAAITWGLWVPPALVGIGLGGFLNELFGAMGAPAGLAPVPPDSVGVAALLFHWAFQHLLLSAFALTLAVRPRWAIAPLEWTLPQALPVADGPQDRETGRPIPSGTWLPGAESGADSPGS